MSDWKFRLGCCWLIVVIIGLAAFAVWRDARLQTICIDNGYAEYTHVGFTRYCVGVRDGNTVFVPLKSLEESK